MRLITWCIALLFVPGLGSAAEKVFDFSGLKGGQLPPGWRAALTGGGSAAQWATVNDDVPPTLERFSPLAPVVSVRPVVAQLGGDRTDERFPMLVYDEEDFGDFKLSTKFKTVGGESEQMAGIAFRILDERNYHVVRASSKGSNLLFYSFIDGQRTSPIGVRADIPTNVWHTLEIEASSTRFVFRLNGKEILPALDNPNFRRGKIGYWTKSDAVSYFVDTRITYQPKDVLAQRLVRSTMARNERLLGLRVLLPGKETGTSRILASSDPAEVDQAGFPEERKVIESGEMMYLARKQDVAVTLPLRDRNGEIIAAVRVTMKRFAGQTAKNAVARAQPIVSEIQAGATTLEGLME